MSSLRCRVLFPLTQDESGYPPVAAESLWARRIGANEYELDNVPFFARGVAAGDRIEAIGTEGPPVFRRVLRRSGHSTVRVVFHEAGKVDEILDACVACGCQWEQSHVPSLYAIDVPPDAPLREILDRLQAEEDSGTLTYEESCLAHRPT